MIAFLSFVSPLLLALGMALVITGLLVFRSHRFLAERLPGWRLTTILAAGGFIIGRVIAGMYPAVWSMIEAGLALGLVLVFAGLAIWWANFVEEEEDKEREL